MRHVALWEHACRGDVMYVLFNCDAGENDSAAKLALVLSGSNHRLDNTIFAYSDYTDTMAPSDSPIRTDQCD